VTPSHDGVPPLAKRIRKRLEWGVRDLWPHRRVVREVQGVRLALPWSHRLPDFADGDSPYGQNLVALAKGLAASGPLVVLDVGANVGDSALQILDACDARIVCVEGDLAYLPFLEENVGARPECRIEASLLAPTAAKAAGQVAPVRAGGTTRFVAGSSSQVAPAVTPTELRLRHPWTEQLRLVKSDTDGHDVALVPAVAEAWADLRPVLFFEYDPKPTRLNGTDPMTVWPALEALGYRQFAVWDNGGHPLGRAGVSQLADAALALEKGSSRAVRYWDVAAVHTDDAEAAALIEELVPAPWSVPRPSPGPD